MPSSVVDTLDGLYAECVNCPNSLDKCPKTMKDIKEGVIPRGFHFEDVPVKILVVGKNPGKPNPGEREKFTNISSDKLLATRHFKIGR